MNDLNDGWKLHVDRGPEWIFCRLDVDSPNVGGEPKVAEAVVAEAQEAGVNRVVFELSDRVMLVSYLVGQLVSLHKRFLVNGGMFRICGFSSTSCSVLSMLRLADRLPNYRDREAAVMGRLP